MLRFLIPAALTLAACAAPPSGGGGGGVDPVVPGNPTPVNLDGSYQLIALNGRPVEGGITLDFEPGGQLGGDAPCNRYFGPYNAASDFSFSAQQIGATRRACPQLQLEGEYFEALRRTTQFRPGREGDTLGLLDGNGRTVASFVRSNPPVAPPPPEQQANIVGDWRIAAVSLNGALTPTQSAPGIGISFVPGRQFNANLGCNFASGPYTLSGLQLDFGAIAVTERQCLVAAPFEGAIIDALERTQTIAPTPAGFDMIDGVGRPVMQLVQG